MASAGFYFLALLIGYPTAVADRSAEVIRIEIEDHKRNLTALQSVIAPPWVSSPGIRGTSDILWSCIATLTGCIYTALHLNISAGYSWKRRLLQKIKWVTVTVLAPEIAVVMAFSQYLEARWLVKELNKYKSEWKDQEKGKAGFTFDMRYGFFVVMGGLQVSYADIANEDGTCNPWSVPNWRQVYYWHQPKHIKTLSAEAVAALAKRGEFIHVPRGTIEDRSKANSIQKALVVLQVLWMVVQCVARKAYGLPLTLLEIHTMVHVFCAFIMYICWFEKPLDVQSPELVDVSSSDRLRNFLSLLLFEDGARIFRVGYRPPTLYPLPVDSQDVLHHSNKSSGGGNGADEQRNERTNLLADLDYGLRRGWLTRLSPMEIILVHRQKEEFLPVRLQPREDNPCGFSLGGHDSEIRVYPGDYLMLQRMIAAKNEIDSPVSSVQKFPRHLLIQEHNERPTGISKWFRSQPNDKESTFLSPSNLWLGPDTESRLSDLIWLSGAVEWPLQVAFYLLPLLYGCIHLTAWNSRFPSNQEQLIWKISCFSISGFLPFLAVFRLSRPAVAYLEEKYFDYNSCLQNKADKCIFFAWRSTVLLVLSPGFLGPLILFVFSRIFIVVEAFISLRGVPIGVYWTPEWLQMIPHV